MNRNSPRYNYQKRLRLWCTKIVPLMYVLESSPSQIELNSPLNFSLPSAESIGNGKFTLRNFLLRKKPLTLSSSSPLRFTRRSEYLTALNRSKSHAKIFQLWSCGLPQHRGKIFAFGTSVKCDVKLSWWNHQSSIVLLILLGIQRCHIQRHLCLAVLECTSWFALEKHDQQSRSNNLLPRGYQNLFRNAVCIQDTLILESIFSIVLMRFLLAYGLSWMVLL